MPKKIGLMIQGGHLLSNGIVQQGHYTKLALMQCGYDVELLSTQPIESYKDLGHSVLVIDIHTDVSSYDIIIFVSALLSSESEDNRIFMSNAKKAGCKFVNLICGNIFYLYQEEIVFNVHHILQSHINTFIDEVWVLPMYEHTIQLLKTFFKRPVKVVPYLWNDDIIRHIVGGEHNLPFYDNQSKASLQNTTLFCAEPNMSVHKNAFISIMSAEEYHTTFRKLNKLCVLCGKKLKLEGLVPHLSLFHDNKVELYDRISFIDILSQCKTKSIPLPIILSHQYLNDLNFVNFETLYLGWPLVHNCDRLVDVGYFYNKDHVHDAALQIEYARLNHKHNYALYMKKVHTFLEKYNPKNPDVSKMYIQLIENLS